jgi:hypothetical protein
MSFRTTRAMFAIENRLMSSSIARGIRREDDAVSAVARCPNERRFAVKNRPGKEGIGARWARTPKVHIDDLRGVDVCRYRGGCRGLHFDLPFSE